MFLFKNSQSHLQFPSQYYLKLFVCCHWADHWNHQRWSHTELVLRFSCKVVPDLVLFSYTTSGLCHLRRPFNGLLNFKLSFFYQLFGCPEASFGPWLRGSCPHPILITALFQVRLGGHWESLKNFGSQSPYERISIARTANLPILSATCYPSVPLSPKSFEVLPIFNDEERPT